MSKSAESSLKRIDSHLDNMENSIGNIDASLTRIENRLAALPTALQLAVIYAVFLFGTTLMVLFMVP